MKLFTLYYHTFICFIVHVINIWLVQHWHTKLFQEAFFGRELIDSSKLLPVTSHEILHSGSDSENSHHSLSRPASPLAVPPGSSATVVTPSTTEARNESEVKSLTGEVGGVDREVPTPGSIGQRQPTPISSSHHDSDVADLGECDAWLINSF